MAVCMCVEYARRSILERIVSEGINIIVENLCLDALAAMSYFLQNKRERRIWLCALPLLVVGVVLCLSVNTT